MYLMSGDAPFVCFQIQTFKDIILQKDNQLMEINQMHEQELFKLAAKSDASADLEQVCVSEETLAVTLVFQHKK